MWLGIVPGLMHQPHLELLKDGYDLIHLLHTNQIPSTVLFPAFVARMADGLQRTALMALSRAASKLLFKGLACLI